MIHSYAFRYAELDPVAYGTDFAFKKYPFALGTIQPGECRAFFFRRVQHGLKHFMIKLFFRLPA